MLRPVNLLVAGLALLAGLALSWAGAARTHDAAPRSQDLLALTEEVQELRRHLQELTLQVQGQSAGTDALARKLAEWKQRADESDAIARALVTRNQNLVSKLADKQSAPEKDSTPPDNGNANASAAPTARGRITKIDPADNTLVEVNLGKDAGLEKHNTLEAFGQSPGSEYIGTLRIFEVYSQRAVCRLVSTNPLKKQALKVGDAVR